MQHTHCDQSDLVTVSILYFQFSIQEKNMWAVLTTKPTEVMCHRNFSTLQRAQNFANTLLRTKIIIAYEIIDQQHIQKGFWMCALEMLTGKIDVVFTVPSLSNTVRQQVDEANRKNENYIYWLQPVNVNFPSWALEMQAYLCGLSFKYLNVQEKTFDEAGRTAIIVTQKSNGAVVSQNLHLCFSCAIAAKLQELMSALPPYTHVSIDTFDDTKFTFENGDEVSFELVGIDRLIQEFAQCPFGT